MLKAIIFDCDGVIADTEPIHMAALQRVLAEHDITLDKDTYLRDYLARDDRGCFRRAFSDRKVPPGEEEIEELIKRKAAYVEPVMRASLELLPGVASLINQASESFPLAVASGALRREIELVLKFGGLRERFQVVVSAEDVSRGKPDPEPFIRALDLLNFENGRSIAPGECLVIEDSIHGIRAAHSAKMRCLAVTNSYPSDALSQADRVVDSLTAITVNDLRQLFDD